ncbi:MAG: DEAD/DEAH box helicase, partial [Proteobacteria bacterium]
MNSLTDTLEQIERMADSELRQRVFWIGGHGPDPGPAYSHQIEALRRIELGATASPPVSGVLHYPTGAGKTRVGLELIARALKEDPTHRFVWATHTKNLIRQSMERMAELSRLFPRETTFSWARDADDTEDDEHDVHTLFMTRDTLTKVLDRAGDRRRAHPWRQRLEDRTRMTLIYDECHQLGAEKLQKSMRKFYEAAVTPARTKPRPWRLIGLSATPVPTQASAHRLLAEQVFPLRDDAPSMNQDWPFHIVHRVHNEALVQSGVLCPLNLYLDKQGDFDIPAPLLRKTIGDAHLRPPGAHADKVLVQQYA